MLTVTRKELWPGVGLTAVHTTKFKSSAMSVTLLTPLSRENAGPNALIPAVLRRGTAAHPDMESLSAALDELYGGTIEPAVRKKGETQAVGFVASFLDDAFAPGETRILEDAVGLLGELLLEPYTQNGAFCPDYTAGERANLIDRIAAQKNDPRSWAPKRLTGLMCENEPYGQPALGTIEQARKITENKLYTAYRRALDEAQIELFYCGTLPPDAVEALFASTPLVQRRKGPFYQPQTGILSQPAGAPREVVEEEQVTQGKLSLGFRTGGSCLTGGDPAAYWMFQTLYGGSTSSKLFLNVRERKSLCYYASAQFIAPKGIMMVNSGIENKDFETARDEILRQLDACRAGDITDAEIESARKTLTTNWRAMLDDPLTLERYWLGQAAAGTLVTPEERIAQVAAVTRGDIVAAAQATALDTVYFMKGAAQ